MLVLCGVDPPVAGAAPRETPAHEITRLRAKAARVQAAIDRTHARVESLVEDYNEVREALARTRRQEVEARRQLRAAKRLLGRRLWTIYTGGAPTTLGQLLGADSVHDALVTAKYQEQVVGADRAALDRVDRLRRQVEALRPGWPTRPSARSGCGPAWPPSAATSSTWAGSYGGP